MDSSKPIRYTIYCHIHIESGRRYVGLTKKTMMQRWNRHIQAANRQLGGWSHFANAIRLYGKDAFSHEVLEVCNSVEAANVAEQKWIEHFKTRDPEFGFNLTPGGAHTPHLIKNPWDRPEFREKAMATLPKLISAGLSPEARAKTVATLRTPEFRQKAAELTRKQFSSPESRQKMSETVKALHQIPEIAEKFASGFRKTNAERASKTRCKHGHEFTPENTRTDENGWRYCKRCAADRAAKKAREERTRCAGGHEFVEGSFKLSCSGERVCLLCVQTHCKRGHELSPENTYLNNRGSRVCKLCERIRGRQSDARRRNRRKASQAKG
jgi:hypothetical protein